MTTQALRNFTVVAAVALVIAVALTVWTAFDSDSSGLSLVLRAVMTVGTGVVAWATLRSWHRQQRTDRLRDEPPATDPD